MFFAIVKEDLQSGDSNLWEVPVPATLESYRRQEDIAQALSVIHDDCSFLVVLVENNHSDINYDNSSFLYNFTLMESVHYFRGSRTTKSCVDLNAEFYPRRDILK